jgi:hypothetical protein
MAVSVYRRKHNGDPWLLIECRITHHLRVRNVVSRKRLRRRSGAGAEAVAGPWVAWHNIDANEYLYIPPGGGKPVRLVPVQERAADRPL